MLYNSYIFSTQRTTAINSWLLKSVMVLHNYLPFHSMKQNVELAQVFEVLKSSHKKRKMKKDIQLIWRRNCEVFLNCLCCGKYFKYYHFDDVKISLHISKVETSATEDGYTEYLINITPITLNFPSIVTFFLCFHLTNQPEI